jgi:predicted signal transduction protein with EAL and GGDEF domain
MRVALDDTGSGFASLSHILKLRPDVVKLDLDLVRGIHTDPARRALAAGLLVFAEQIGACLVAEGVETELGLTGADVGAHGAVNVHFVDPTSCPGNALGPCGDALRHGGAELWH